MKKSGHDDLKMSSKEIAKVCHDINNVWHSRYQGKKRCVIYTSSYEVDSSSYAYIFDNFGFAQYEFIGKVPI